MKYIRPLASVEVSVSGRSATFTFTRSFLADSFKGIRNREAKSSELHSTKLNSDCFPPIANVHSQHSSGQTSKSRTNINTQQSTKKTNRPVVYPNKYFLLVSPCLSLLRGEEPSSDTDYSSSDSEDSDKRVFDIPQPYRLNCATHQSAAVISTERQEQVGSEQKSCDVDILNEDVDELYIQLAKLGLPTAFGSTRKSRVDCNQNQPELDPETRYDITFLCCARNHFQKWFHRPRRSERRRRSCSDTHSRPTQTTDDHCTTIFASGLNHGVSSDNLNDYRRNVFANLCYLLELACAFEQAGSVPFQMENFYLPRAWTLRDFNLEAFLYSCERYWRYEPPTVEPPSITVFSEESSNSSDLAKIGSDPELGKYWAQRFRLFSRFNEGIQLDRDGFFSATPEAIAYHQAVRVKQSYAAKGIPAESLTVIDACSGSGANSIQFALVGFQVVAVEIDSKRIEMAVHNAEIYGVAEKIKFVCADFFDWARRELQRWNCSSQAPLSSPYAALFMSPPWGGPAYLDSDVFDLNWIHFGPRNEMAGCTFWFSVQLASQLTEGNLLLFLPRNSNMAQLPKFAECLTSAALWSSEGPCKISVEVEANVLNAKVKAISLYTGCLCTRK